ncbi:hypothetical protein T261_03461 [Streptomyces lydicus]|nr:hypothetical protein T261_03461 [Streptomyces lydicus]
MFRGGAPALWSDQWRCRGPYWAREAVRQASSWMRLTRRNRFDRMRSVPGVPRTDHPIGCDRAAVPC